MASLRSPGAEPPSSVRSDIQSFQFVAQTNLQLPSSNNQLAVHIPSFIPKQHIIAPQGTKEVQLCIASGSYSIIERKITSAHSLTLNIPYTQTEIAKQAITLPIYEIPQHITVTALSMLYKIIQSGSQSLITVQQYDWKAADIIDFRCNESGYAPNF